MTKFKIGFFVCVCFCGDLNSSNYIAFSSKHEIVPIWVIGGTCGTSYIMPSRPVNPFTLLWSIKKEKWFTGPKLPKGLIEFASHGFLHMCATSVGSNSAFILDKRKTFSFNFKTKLKVNLATICLLEKKPYKL